MSLLDKLDEHERNKKRVFCCLELGAHKVTGFTENGLINFAVYCENWDSHRTLAEIQFDAAKLQIPRCFDSKCDEQDLEWSAFKKALFKSDFDLVLLGSDLCVVMHPRSGTMRIGKGTKRDLRSIFNLGDQSQ
jgi:hypothetical protein